MAAENWISSLSPAAIKQEMKHFLNTLGSKGILKDKVGSRLSLGF